MTRLLGLTVHAVRQREPESRPGAEEGGEAPGGTGSRDVLQAGSKSLALAERLGLEANGEALLVHGHQLAPQGRHPHLLRHLPPQPPQ